MNSRKFANSIMPFLVKYNDYTEKDFIIARYGLESLYTLISKTIVLIIISILMHNTKVLFLFIFFYGFIRTYAGGFHLSNGTQCLFFTTIFFIGGTILINNIEINLIEKILVSILALTNIAIYCPADTHKKPIIRKKLREKRKGYSIIICLIYIILLFIFKNNVYVNCIYISLILTIFTIHPFGYKLFKQSYNNYLLYENYIRKEG